MNISISGMTGNLWIHTGGKDHGPFNTILDATWTAVDMVTDAINAEPGHSVKFLAPEVH